MKNQDKPRWNLFKYGYKKIRRTYERYHTDGFIGIMRWIKFLVRITMRDIRFYLTYHLYYKFKTPYHFSYRSKKYQQFWKNYNATWLNERAVEIPIIMDIIQSYRGKRILEVGNVLSNYFSVTHDVLDKYDSAFGVIRRDAARFIPEEKYDLIVSISTIEHIGFDETPQDLKKIPTTIENLKMNCLNENGKMVITLPLGYNANLDGMIELKELEFDTINFLKRINKKNQWKEVSWDEARGGRYNFPFPFANVVAICEATR
ncbi:MAG TPA: hypothetical protein VJC20_00410 [Candidatus Paceibacterota bacterium]